MLHAHSPGGKGALALQEDCTEIDKGVSALRMTAMTQFYADTFMGAFEAKGVSIRNTWSGTISLSEIPAGATIREAYLYWMVLNPYPACSTGTFDGNTLDGVLAGRDQDPCWGLSESCYVWRQEVTSWVGGNGSYAVEIDSVIDGTGNDKGEGASLIALYEDGAEPEKVFLIYDGCVTLIGSSHEYQWSMTGFTADFPCTEAKAAFVIGDGQGVGQGDSMFYNATCIDWNTTEGYDGPYWDTRTYDVTALTPGGSTQSDFRYHPAASKDDCVTLGVCAFGVSRDLVAIELTSFTARQVAEGMVVEWRTESEVDISYYVLRRAWRGSEYVDIVSLPGKGNSPQSNHYAYVDRDIEPSMCYRYMLGAVHGNGQARWFGPISIISRAAEPIVAVKYTNPVGDVLSITCTMAQQSHLLVEIRDVGGRLVETLVDDHFPPGTRELVWDARPFSDGIYFVVVRTDRGRAMQKVVFVR